MKQASLAKQERENIFKQFLKNKKLKFSEIETAIGTRSNHLTYHLEQMQRDGLVEKQDEGYTLTNKAEQLIPFFSHMTGKEVGVLPVVLVAIKKNNKICLLKREKRPYQGYWGLIGGKPKLHESIQEAALREVKEETGLDCEFHSLNAIVHERVREQEEVKHAFLLLLTTVIPKSEKLIKSDEGGVAWFDLKQLDKRTIIPSDYWMIKSHVGKTIALPHVVIEQDGDNLKLQ